MINLLSQCPKCGGTELEQSYVTVGIENANGIMIYDEPYISWRCKSCRQSRQHHSDIYYILFVGGFMDGEMKDFKGDWSNHSLAYSPPNSFPAQRTVYKNSGKIVQINGLDYHIFEP